MWLPWMEFAAVLTAATLLTIPMGQWLARCFTSERHGWLERLSYRVMGVNPQERMGWQRYGAVLVLAGQLDRAGAPALWKQALPLLRLTNVPCYPAHLSSLDAWLTRWRTA